MTAALQRIHDAPIVTFLEARGFRRQKNRWACHAHDDKRPSCTIRNNRLHCWVCDCTWSSIDLVMHLDGVDLNTAVQQMADFYGIPADDRPMTAFERKRYARRRAQAEREAESAQWFGYAAHELADELLEKTDSDDPERFGLIELRRIAIAGGPALLDEYLTWRTGTPKLTAGMVKAGRRSDQRKQRLLATFVLTQGERDAAA